MGMKRRLVLTAAAATIVAAVAAWHPGISLTDSGPRAVVNSAEQSSPKDLSALLKQVRVVDAILPVAGYQRSCSKVAACVFGPSWNDPLDHSGCDTRNRLLAQTLRDVKFKPGTQHCKVIAGVLDPDPYTGNAIDLKDVAVDHIVPLRLVWSAGAWEWDEQQRQIFANDMTELIAVSSRANAQKGDSSLAEWSPANPAEKCRYAMRYVTVSVKYDLPITRADRSTATTLCRTA